MKMFDLPQRCSGKGRRVERDGRGGVKQHTESQNHQDMGTSSYSAAESRPHSWDHENLESEYDPSLQVQGNRQGRPYAQDS